MFHFTFILPRSLQFATRNTIAHNHRYHVYTNVRDDEDDVYDDEDERGRGRSGRGRRRTWTWSGV